MMHVAEKQSEEVGNLRGLLLQKSHEKKQTRKGFEEERKRRNNDLQRLSIILKRIEELEGKLSSCETEIKEIKQNNKVRTNQKMEAQRELDAQRWKEETAKLALQSFKEKSLNEEKKHTILVKQEEKMNSYIGQSNAETIARKAEIDLKLRQLTDLKYKKDDLRKHCVENEVKFLSAQERNKHSKQQLKDILSELVILKEENSRYKVDCEEGRTKNQEIQTFSGQLIQERDELLSAVCEQESSVKVKKRDLHEEKSRADMKMLELQDLQSRLEQLEMEWQLSLQKSNQLDPISSSFSS